MIKFTFIFLFGIAYAAQTRIKIGSQSWGYQIELNQGQNIRTEFANDDGVVLGTYTFKTNNNETKKLEYRIDPNRMEPDISFNVMSVAPSSSQPKADTDVKPSTVSPLSEEGSNNSINAMTLPSEVSTNKSMLNTDPLVLANMSFDSIDSKQDFKGHVTIKVGNSTYSINFVTGDKSNSREETLNTNGVLIGRFSYLMKPTQTKLVINYKFNSSAADPTFEVSLFKTIETDSSPSALGGSVGVGGNSGNYHQSPRDNYRLGYQRHYPTFGGAGGGGSVGGGGTGHNAAYPAVPSSPARPSSHYMPTEKYRSSSRGESSLPHPNWYYNRVKAYDP